MKLFVVIVTFNSEKYIGKCLESLSEADVQAKVVVVDNNSTDGSVEKIKNLKVKSQNDKSKLKIIQGKTNVGFAGGSNVGIRYALKHGATHILLLNPDMVVEKNFLKPLLDNDADIVGPVGGRVNFILGRPKHTDGASSVDFITGACMVVKREVFEKIGLFDTRFFLYFEDVDFCLRAKRDGLPAVRLSSSAPSSLSDGSTELTVEVLGVEDLSSLPKGSPSKSGRQGFSVSMEPKSRVVHHTAVGVDKPFVSNLHLLKSNFIFINRWVPLAAKPFAYFYWMALSSKIISEYFLRWILHKS